jgi:hypothetical protein
LLDLYQGLVSEFRHKTYSPGKHFTENLMALLTVAVLSRLKCLETVTGH